MTRRDDEPTTPTKDQRLADCLQGATLALDAADKEMKLAQLALGRAIAVLREKGGA